MLTTSLWTHAAQGRKEGNTRAAGLKGLFSLGLRNSKCPRFPTRCGQGVTRATYVKLFCSHFTVRRQRSPYLFLKGAAISTAFVLFQNGILWKGVTYTKPQAQRKISMLKTGLSGHTYHQKMPFQCSLTFSFCFLCPSISPFNCSTCVLLRFLQLANN